MAIKLFNFDRMKGYILVKTSFYGILSDYNVIWETPKIISSTTDINYDRFDNNLINFIIEFEYILNNVIEGIDLNLFYNKVNTLTYENMTNISGNDIFTYDGLYSLKANKIIYQSCCRSVLGHELFHMASAVKLGDKSYVGFMQTNDDGDIGIGVGLNEGYTQMLTERYIEKEEYSRYPLTQFFVKKVEDIVGKVNMQKMYFKADLEGLVSFLEKYNTRKNISRFINILDVVTTYEKLYTSDMVDRKIIECFFKKAFRDMSNFLFCTLMNKIKTERNNPEYDVNQLIEMGNSFIQEFLGNLYYRDKEYTLLTNINIANYSIKSRIKKK